MLHVCVVSVGVAGWNTSAAWFGHVGALSGGRRLARTLLGPEKTPAWCFFWWTIPGLAGLTHWLFGVVAVWGVRGVVVC